MSRLSLRIFNVACGCVLATACGGTADSGGTARLTVNAEEQSTAKGIWQQRDVLNGGSDELQIWGGTGDESPDYARPGFHCEVLTDNQGNNVATVLRGNSLPATFVVAPLHPTVLHKPDAWHSGDAVENACGIWLGDARGVCSLTSGKIVFDKVEDKTLYGSIQGDGFLEQGGAACSAGAVLTLVPEGGPPRFGVAL
jgi:hypothetical protein